MCVCVRVHAGFSSRPRYLKVFINPSSHKKEAVHIYREHVAPLFKMADVRTDITGQSIHLLLSTDHQQRDVIIILNFRMTVGGAMVDFLMMLHLLCLVIKLCIRAVELLQRTKI